MKKCLLWGSGKDFRMHYKLIRYYIKMQEIELVGITSNDVYFKSIMGIPFIPKSEINANTIDKVIVMVDSDLLREIYAEITAMLHVDDRDIVPIKVMSLPGFDFDKYAVLRSNVPSIISPNCWAGMVYNSLGLEFKSPLINMYEDHDDYIKLLKNLSFYMNEPLEFLEMKYEGNLKRDFPVAKCGDITLFFNHYKTFEEANTCWIRRKQRLNKNNIIAMFYDDDKNRVNEFLNLDYEEKICFVPYQSNNPAIISLSGSENPCHPSFWKVVNDGAHGYIYDIFELLLNNKYVKLSELK